MPKPVDPASVERNPQWLQFIPMIAGAAAQIWGAASSANQDTPEAQTPFSHFPGGNKGLALLSLLSSLEGRGETDRASGLQLQKLFQALGNTVSMSNRNVPAIYDLAQRTHDQIPAAGRAFSQMTSASSGIPSASNSNRFWDVLRMQLPRSPGAFQMGGGMSPEQLGATPYETGLVSKVTGNAAGPGGSALGMTGMDKFLWDLGIRPTFQGQRLLPGQNPQPAQPAAAAAPSNPNPGARRRRY